MNAKVIEMKDYIAMAPQYDAGPICFRTGAPGKSSLPRPELREWITCVVENLVMLAVAGCTIFSVFIALTML